MSQNEAWKRVLEAEAAWVDHAVATQVTRANHATHEAGGPGSWLLTLTFRPPGTVAKQLEAAEHEARVLGDRLATAEDEVVATTAPVERQTLAVSWAQKLIDRILARDALLTEPDRAWVLRALERVDRWCGTIDTEGTDAMARFEKALRALPLELHIQGLPTNAGMNRQEAVLVSQHQAVLGDARGSLLRLATTLDPHRSTAPPTAER